VSLYGVAFEATSPDPLEDGVAARLTRAIAGMPGVEVADAATADVSTRLVAGSFRIRVEQAMADAARDGSRLAKQALSLAGLPEAKLVGLEVRLLEDAP
jgi:hypothetical protein